MQLQRSEFHNGYLDIIVHKREASSYDFAHDKPSIHLANKQQIRAHLQGSELSKVLCRQLQQPCM